MAVLGCSSKTARCIDAGEVEKMVLYKVISLNLIDQTIIHFTTAENFACIPNSEKTYHNPHMVVGSRIYHTGDS